MLESRLASMTQKRQYFPFNRKLVSFPSRIPAGFQSITHSCQPSLHIPLSSLPTAIYKSPSSFLPPYPKYHVIHRYCSTLSTQEERDLNSENITHIGAVEMMRESKLIDSNLAFSLLKKTDPEWFLPNQSYTNIAKDLVDVSEIDEAEMVMADDWLHSALTIIAIITLAETVIKPGSRVLDLGCGYGYMSTLLAQMVYPGGQVVAIDKDQERLESAKQTIKLHFPHLINTIEFQCDDIFQCQQISSSTFDFIHAGGVFEVAPEPWLQRLKVGASLITAFPELVEPNKEEIDTTMRPPQVQKNNETIGQGTNESEKDRGTGTENTTHIQPRFAHMLRKIERINIDTFQPVNMMYVNYEKFQI